MDKPEHTVEIIKSYRDYQPPIDATTIARTLMRHVPPKCVIGLDRIVLTNTAALPRNRRRGKTRARKRKVRIAEARGLYHPRSNNQPAWIEIFVDNFWEYERRAFRKIAFLRDIVLADALYHELGHHIHHTLRPEHRERENVADEWAARLTAHFIKKYGYLRPLMRLNRRIVNTGWFQRTFPKPF